MVNTEDHMHKPTFDGRQPYYIVIRDIMRYISASTANGDSLMPMLRGMRVLYNMVCPYVKETDANQIKEKLVAVHKGLNNLERLRLINNPTVRMQYALKANELDMTLLDIHEDIHKAARDFFLTTSSGESEKFDMDKILGDMDL